MRYRTVKSANEIGLNDVRVEFEFHDKNLRSVRITDKNGKFFIVQAGESYSNSVKVLVEEPFDQVDRWKVEGSVVGIPVSEYFEYEHEADDRVREIARATEDSNSVTKVKVKALVNEAGEVVGEAA